MVAYALALRLPFHFVTLPPVGGPSRCARRASLLPIREPTEGRQPLGNPVSFYELGAACGFFR